VDVARKAAPSARGARNSFKEFHAFLARLLDVPELEMSDEDAARFTEAYREVRKHFPVPAVDPKWVALVTFGYVAFGVYSPRVAAIAAKKRGQAPNAPRGASPAPMPAPQAPEVADWFAGTA
jgi:hypothetical protein